jgi:hypothetical protein
MQMTSAIRSSHAFIRCGHLELHLERHAERSPEGLLSVTHTVHGEVVLKVGRWALQRVNHQRVQAWYAARKFCCSRLGELLGPHVIIKPPKAINKHHPKAMGRNPNLDPHQKRGVC